MYMEKFWLYLDDLRTPTDERWHVVRSYPAFVTFVESVGLENIERISFDHDLGPTAMNEYYNGAKVNYSIDYSKITEKTGYDCTKWLVTHSMDTGVLLPDIYIHSANPIGAANIMGYVNNYNKNCRVRKEAQLFKWDHTILDNE